VSPSAWKPPDPFLLLHSADTLVWVHPEARRWAEDCLDRGVSLHEDAGASSLDGDQEILHGRGPVYLVEGGKPGERWAVRHFHRGGLLGSLLEDRYFRSPALPRPLAEAKASERCRERGIPTPQVVAAAVYGGGLIYRGDLVTRYIPESMTLARLLHSEEANLPQRLRALEMAGGLVGLLEEKGVLHPDLNVKNILFTPASEPREVHLLDLDRVRVSAGGPVPGRPMFQRLARSLRKWENRSGSRLPDPAWAALLRGWEEKAG
jgi:3-deoxy-D-manno-octulosonic acid kinase